MFSFNDYECKALEWHEGGPALLDMCNRGVECNREDLGATCSDWPFICIKILWSNRELLIIDFPETFEGSWCAPVIWILAEHAYKNEPLLQVARKWGPLNNTYSIWLSFTIIDCKCVCHWVCISACIRSPFIWSLKRIFSHFTPFRIISVAVCPGTIESWCLLSRFLTSKVQPVERPKVS